MATRDKMAGQRQLALDEQPERSLPPTYASYEWTGEGLSERSGSDAVVYSYWDRPFACTLRRQHREPEDLLPDWPVLDAPDYGRVAGEKSVLAHHPRTLGTGIAAGPGAEAAINDYLATLPRLLTRLAAPFGARQWLLLDLFRRSGDLWKLVHRQTALGRLGTLSLTLELFCAAGRTAPRSRQNFAEFLTLSTREIVLHRFLGKQPTPALLASLERFPPGACLLDESAIKTVLAPGTGTPSQDGLARLEDKLTRAILTDTGWTEMADIRSLIDKGVPLPRLIATINAGLRNLTAPERPAALRSLRQVTAPQALQWWLSHWTTLASRSRSFPAPPIPPSSLLTPLETAAALSQESRRMRNGIDRYLADVLAGDLYFYHFDGAPAATLCLAATGKDDWLLLDALGEDGTRLQDEAFQEILPSLMPVQRESA
jgi:hypothetical protein